MELKLLKSDDRGKVYQADGFKVFYRKKETVSGDNADNPKELIYVLHGKVKFTLQNSTRTVEAPWLMEIPEATYHKIEAVTDIIFIVF